MLPLHTLLLIAVLPALTTGTQLCRTIKMTYTGSRNIVLDHELTFLLNDGLVNEAPYYSTDCNCNHLIYEGRWIITSGDMETNSAMGSVGEEDLVAAPNFDDWICAVSGASSAPQCQGMDFTCSEWATATEAPSAAPTATITTAPTDFFPEVAPVPNFYAVNQNDRVVSINFDEGRWNHIVEDGRELDSGQGITMLDQYTLLVSSYSTMQVLKYVASEAVRTITRSERREARSE